MVRLRPVRPCPSKLYAKTGSIRVLTFEEQTRVANFFMLLIEIDQQKGITQKRRSPKSASKPSRKASADKKASRSSHKATQPSPTAMAGRLTDKKVAKSESQKLQPASKTSTERTPSRSPRVRKAQSRPTNSRRDLFLKPFARIFNCSKITFILGIHCNDRHHNLNAC